MPCKPSAGNSKPDISKLALNRNRNSKPECVTPRMSVIDRVMAKLGLDQLAAALANQLGEKLLATVNIDGLVDVLFDKYHEEFEHTFTQAVLDRL